MNSNQGKAARLFGGLARMRNKVTDALSASELDDIFDDLETMLLEADAGTATARAIVARARNKAGSQANLETAGQAIRAEFAEVLAKLHGTRPQSNGKPHVILLVGSNGSGKTTTAAKLAHQAASRGQTVVLAACDTFRAAAAEQLRSWSEFLGAKARIVTGAKDPGAVAFAAVSSARAKADDLVLIDTAGRQTSNKGLMAEASKIARATAKALPGAPHETILAIDANTGQNALTQIAAFNTALTLTGIVLTKLDSTARGGAILAAAENNPCPVLFVGVGEDREDLLKFDATEFANALLSYQPQTNTPATAEKN